MARSFYWIHGNAAQAYRQAYFIERTCDGFGSVFQTHGKEWIFFPVPTPTLLGDRPARLSKIVILYRTERTAQINAVHIDDASTKLKIFPNLKNWSGDHSTKEDALNTLIIAPPLGIKHGINVGVYVEFGEITNVGVPRIVFSSVGCCFEY